MSTPTEIYHNFLNASDAERLNIAKQSAYNLAVFLRDSGLDEDTRTTFFFSALGLFIAADLKVTNAETKMFNDLLDTNYSSQELVENFSHCTQGEWIQKMDEIIDAMPEENKYDLCLLGLAFLTSDRELTKREIAIFEKILG